MIPHRSSPIYRVSSWVWSSHAAAVPFHMLSQWQPSNSNFAVYGLLLLGGEIRGGKTGAKSARHNVWWGVGLLFLAYEAMTSDRPYRAALPVAEARAELQRCAGRQYDPQVVEAFLGVLAEENGKSEEARLTGTLDDAQLIESQAALEAEAG
jgi:hypothetical protein